MQGFVRIVGLFLLALLLQACQPAEGSDPAGHAQSHDKIGEVALADLPPEAQQTLRAIRQGGPFSFDRDGVVFGNYERVLPKQPRGYYHEYTVKTPGAHNRGTRRIVAGKPGEYYYSADHYKTFNQIRE